MCVRARLWRGSRFAGGTAAPPAPEGGRIRPSEGSPRADQDRPERALALVEKTVVELR